MSSSRQGDKRDRSPVWSIMQSGLSETRVFLHHFHHDGKSSPSGIVDRTWLVGCHSELRAWRQILVENFCNLSEQSGLSFFFFFLHTQKKLN